MRYHWLGRSGLRVSVIGLGTSPFGQGMGSVSGVGQTEANAIVAAALESGVNFFDTADAYSAGESEEILGRALGARRSEAVLATKAGARSRSGINEAGSSRRHLLRALDESLRRLRTDWVDLFYVHLDDGATGTEELVDTLASLVRSGKVRAVGLSNFPAWRLVHAADAARAMHLPPPSAYQGLWNLLARDIEHEIAPACAELGIAVVAWAPLAGGHLTGKYRDGRRAGAPGRLTEPGSDLLQLRPESVAAVVDGLEAIARQRGASVGQVALAWLLAQPVLTAAIVGARTLHQLHENLAAADLVLDPHEIEAIDDLAPRPRQWPAWHLALRQEARFDPRDSRERERT